MIREIITFINQHQLITSFVITMIILILLLLISIKYSKRIDDSDDEF